MTHRSHVAKADGCPSDCRNGQIWNPGSGPYPCPFCQSDNSSQGGGK
ncbi:hypothetical protein [Sphaerisporangium rhizosphaerae]|uniref:Uncharacterized protein n=1 Tax=Sphaerisporangium rhizosphaerae TaxID=2269375 RepID=A0ABW2P1J0_9ACTN